MEWSASKTEMGLILKAVKRTEELTGISNRMTMVMDLEACHCNGNPLNLVALAGAENDDLLHDVLGIGHHIDRGTGELRDCFSPRYSEAYHPII